jgi:hypothetical protein
MLIFCAKESTAQLIIKKGLKGGFNFSSLSSDMETNYNSRTAAAFGGYIKLNLLRLAFQAELLYAQKGAKIDASDAEIKISYLEIPVLVKYQRFIVPLISYNIYAGPSFAFKLDEDIDSNLGKDVISSSDVGIAFGAGLNISALISEVNIDARYVLGLSNVWNGEAAGKLENRAFMVMVGIAL